MLTSEIRELSNQTRIDAKRLFKISELLFKLSLAFNWTIGIIGLIAAAVTANKSGAGAVVILLFTAVTCGIVYIGSVLSTHVSKVLAHTSLACIALVENIEERK